MKKLISVMAIVGLFLYTTVSAETFVSKNWLWNTDDENFYFAVTGNAAGNLMGQYCYFKSGLCTYLVGIGIKCKEGDQYPALINSDAGACSVNLVCAAKFEEQNFLFVNRFEDIDGILRKATIIGIAVPIDNDQFKVSRFNLDGSINAIDLMRAAFEAKKKSEPQKSSLPDEERL